MSKYFCATSINFYSNLIYIFFLQLMLSFSHFPEQTYQTYHLSSNLLYSSTLIYYIHNNICVSFNCYFNLFLRFMYLFLIFYTFDVQTRAVSRPNISKGLIKFTVTFSFYVYTFFLFLYILTCTSREFKG